MVVIGGLFFAAVLLDCGVFFTVDVVDGGLVFTTVFVDGGLVFTVGVVVAVVDGKSRRKNLNCMVKAKMC